MPREDGGFASVQFRGVAPDADVVGIKVLDHTGQGRASHLIAGIFWAIAHKDEYGIDVLNISVGGNPVSSIKHDPVARAVEIAWQHGIVVVCAAGNEGDFGKGGILSPGNDPFVITVGATDTRQTANVADDVVASYSSIGPTLFDQFAKPDLVAPGNRLISLRASGSYIDTNFPENVVPIADYAAAAPAGTASNYLTLSGTSTSAPLVAGAAALMLSEDPSLSPDDDEGAPDGDRRSRRRHQSLPAGRRDARCRRGARRHGTRRRLRPLRLHGARQGRVQEPRLLQVGVARLGQVRLDEVQVDEVQVDEVQVDPERLERLLIHQVQVDGIRVDEVQVDRPPARAMITARLARVGSETASSGSAPPSRST